MIESIEQGRKEDGNRSIADKIIKRLHDLGKTIQHNQGRWAWELLQNAKDSIAENDARKVSVQIELEANQIEFRHNGAHFTEKDIRGLINQISSKEIEEVHELDIKKTGRFGTGFLTTHLLSKVIQIKGIVETSDSFLYSFEFPLDRQAKTTTELIPKIESSWRNFQESARKIDFINPEEFNTSFTYQLESASQKNIANTGINEFVSLLPFVLASIPKIGKVEIINRLSVEKTIYINKPDTHPYIKEVSVINNDRRSEKLILYKASDKVSIGIPVIKTDNGHAVESIRDTPKLFCDFPLIGTESFHFPVMINSFYFNPLTERNGIWLSDCKLPQN